MPADSKMLPRSHSPASEWKGVSFSSTHWSVVLAAGHPSSPRCQEALEKLCRSYWYPLYAFIRRQGYSAHDAQDLTQAFFHRLLERNYVSQADPHKGKFRSFLLGAVKHFLANEWDKSQAQKRGGGQVVFSLDAQNAEERYLLEPMDENSPEKIYERRWAMTVLEQAVSRLREEYEEAGKGKLFEELKRFNGGEREASTYAEAAARLGIPENTLKSHVRRLRQRNRELIRLVVGQTVSSRQEVDEEIRRLLAVIES